MIDSPGSDRNLPAHFASGQRAFSTSWTLDKTVRNLRALRTPYDEAVSFFQERFIVRVLMAQACHLGRAAVELGMHRNTLTRTLRDLNIDVQQLRRMQKQPRPLAGPSFPSAAELRSAGTILKS
jgi:Fis family transcriptional regulator